MIYMAFTDLPQTSLQGMIVKRSWQSFSLLQMGNRHPEFGQKFCSSAAMQESAEVALISGPRDDRQLLHRRRGKDHQRSCSVLPPDRHVQLARHEEAPLPHQH